MYYTNQLEDGRVELYGLKPVTVAVFFDAALAETVAKGLNNLENLRDIISRAAAKRRAEEGAEDEGGEDEVVKTNEDDVSAPDFHGVTVEIEEAPVAADEFDTEFETLTPADADQLLDAIIASKPAEFADNDAAATATEEVSPTIEAAVAEVAAPRGEPTEADWADAFVAVEGGSDMAKVAETLGVTMPKLRGRYVAWKGAKKKTAAQPVAAFNAPIAKLPDVSAQKDEPKPGWWRELTEFLGKLGYRGGWSAGLDLALVEGLASGKQMAVVADEIGKEVGEAKARFIALTPNGVTIERQTRLLQVLRARAGVLK
ncbi:hypothetical protein [Rhodobacter capsulatus]|uniref:hypothetical protein n=1 Tax=Rhodobacter capsulatus TaxID=1061 RepID=UPI00402A1CCB